LNRLSRSKGWSCGPNNPYFDEWCYLTTETKAKNKREYKLERRKYDRPKEIGE
tara:strand:- start:18 stop:176 length:159 start_codon:yes stop_codon:yes gene_type:complete